MIIDFIKGNGGGSGSGSTSNVLPAITTQAEYAAISGSIKTGDLIQVLGVDLDGDGEPEFGLFEANSPIPGELYWYRRDNQDSIKWGDENYPWMTENDVFPIEIDENGFLISPTPNNAYNGIGFDADGNPVITHIVPQYDEQTGDVTGMTRTDAPIGGGIPVGYEAVDWGVYNSNAQIVTIDGKVFGEDLYDIPSFHFFESGYSDDERGYVIGEGEVFGYYDEDENFVPVFLPEGTYAILSTNEDENEGKVINLFYGKVGDDDVIYNNSNYAQQLDSISLISPLFTIAEPTCPTIENNYYELYLDYKEGSDSPIVPISSLDDEGVEGVLYEMNGHLYKWIDGDGKWGRWIYNIYDGNGYGDFGNKENYLVYTDLRPADGEKICALRLISKYYRVELDLDDESLYIYDDRYSGGNLVATVVPNSAVTITNSSRSFRITWCPEENYIEFFAANAWAEVLDMMSTNQTGAHFEALLVDDFRAKNQNGANYGIPAWNSDGTVVGRFYNLDKSVKKINTTGFTNNINLYTDGVHQSYGSWFIPTQPGNAGQVLTSAGNAEPQWATIIKAMQITSAAYDALVQAGTTDPNTLYLIVD